MDSGSKLALPKISDCRAPWRYPGGVLGMSGGCLGYLSGFHGHQRRSDVCGRYLGSQSLHYFGTALKGPFLSHLTTLRHQNIDISIYNLNKNGWGLPSFSFLKRVREKS